MQIQKRGGGGAVLEPEFLWTKYDPNQYFFLS